MNTTTASVRGETGAEEDPSGCALCGNARLERCSADLPRLGSRTPSRFHIARCSACGGLQTRPLPSRQEVAESYGAAYTWHGDEGLTARLEAAYRRTLVRFDQLRTVRRAAHLAGGVRLIDVGCADGLLISLARRHGLLAFGIDRADAPLWPECRPEWRIGGDIETIEQPAGSWDVVSLLHVAEHLRAPRRMFAAVHRWLRPGGTFVVQTPNAACFEARWLGGAWFGWDVPRHVVHFTPQTLMRALDEAGFEVIAVRHLSWRDNGPSLVASLFPGLDPLVEREVSLRSGATRAPLATLIRRLAYVALTWAVTPVSLLETALRRSPTVTVLARKR